MSDYRVIAVGFVGYDEPIEVIPIDHTLERFIISNPSTPPEPIRSRSSATATRRRPTAPTVTCTRRP